LGIRHGRATVPDRATAGRSTPADRTTPKPEIAFMVRSQTEKQQRFMALFQPAQPRLQRFVLAMTRDPERTKDIVGETILIAFQRFETLRHDGAFLSFLFTIATRVAHRNARTGSMTTLDSDEAGQLADPSTPADVAADIGRLHAALQLLPEKQREAVLLFEIAGFSTAEVRDVQGGTLVAVRVRLARGRKRLAALLGVQAPSPLAATERMGDDTRSSLKRIGSELETELGI
jgi:RNA polymerase sigma-70 factor (ECF subfamily)